MKCVVCNGKVIEEMEICMFCKGEGCFLCDHTGEVTHMRCTNPDCEPPDYNIEPWVEPCDENE